MCLPDVEFDYINPYDATDRVNRKVREASNYEDTPEKFIYTSQSLKKSSHHVYETKEFHKIPSHLSIHSSLLCPGIYHKEHGNRD
ncbi:unnamed protein product [Rhodiola kirilowii]